MLLLLLLPLLLLLLYALLPLAAPSLLDEVASVVSAVALLNSFGPVRLLGLVLLPKLPLVAASLCCCCCCDWWMCKFRKPGAASACSWRAAARYAVACRMYPLLVGRLAK
jgi:hypothetical protein